MKDEARSESCGAVRGECREMSDVYKLLLAEKFDIDSPVADVGIHLGVQCPAGNSVNSRSC